MADLLIQAMSAKQNGDMQLARQLLSQAIVQNPRNESAWMLMYEIVDDDKIRRDCLQRVIAINPNNVAANTALNRLNSPLPGTVIHGERNKPPDTPVDPTKVDKTSPFTPPFTWDGQPEQYLALGDLTFPDLTSEQATKLPETPPTFDWASESAEPDKAIDKIFEAVSKPELASEPPPEQGSSWLDGLRPSDDIIEQPAEVNKAVEKLSAVKQDDPWLQELAVSPDAEIQPERPLTEDDFSVSAEPELGLRAFAPSDQPVAPEEADSLLWYNPRARTDRLVMLSYRSLIYANPGDADVPNIIELFNQNRMVRDLLGPDAHMIKLETIERVTANPESANMTIEYKPGDKIISRVLNFSSSQVRDEVLTALKFRMGAGFKQSSHVTTLEDKILSPIVIIVLVAVITWVLLGGVPLLSKAPGFDIGAPQAFLSSVQHVIDQVGSAIIILVAVLICGACGIWMALNLRKPASEIILKR